MPKRAEVSQPAVVGMSFKLSVDQRVAVFKEANQRDLSVSRLIRDALKERIGNAWPT